MTQRNAPQPSVDRLTPFRGHPIVVGVEPGQPELVAVTAASWARALEVPVYFAFADPSRVAVREQPDGSVEHTDLNPDVADEGWQKRGAQLQDTLAVLMASTGVEWQFRYLAGRPDRALTHLARAVDASAIVVGTRRPGAAGRMHELLDGAVATHLTHHQHRPVLVVPLVVVDWKTALP